MTAEHLPLVCVALALVAFLYSSVGHAGASGYIAVLTLFGYAPGVIKPVALVLNILVACLATWQFWRAGYFSWRLFWPFAALSVPFAFLGGYLSLPVQLFKIMVGLVLLYSAFRFFLRTSRDEPLRQPSRPKALSIGASLGLLSGITGTGGGIFLTPLLVFRRWAGLKTAAAVSALFILLNSIAGLLGNLSSTKSFPALAWVFMVMVILGGAFGSFFGSRKATAPVINRLLAVVLSVAGLKLLLV